MLYSIVAAEDDWEAYSKFQAEVGDKVQWPGIKSC